LYGPVNHGYTSLRPFVDFDGDGVRDLAVLVFPSQFTSNASEIRILSGVNRAVLTQLPIVTSPVFAHAGDVDGDGSPDIAVHWPLMINWPSQLSAVQVWSLATKQMLWQVLGSYNGSFGLAILGNLDTDGDGYSDLVTITARSFESDVYVYDHLGQLRYTVPLSAYGFAAISLANMGDMDGDGCDDFIVGCADPGGLGAVLMVSGQDGHLLRRNFGMLPNDRTAEHVTNLGDIDGDGVNDYAAFPYWSSFRHCPVLWSGATGNVIRTLDGVYTEFVVATEDLDLDGVNDLVVAAEYFVAPPNTYGRSTAISGRDGTTLWVLDNTPGTIYSHGDGWGRFGAPIGVLPGNPYPAVAWLDLHYSNSAQAWNATGRIRALYGTPLRQGPVTGVACSSNGQLPQIGVRSTATGSRITVAKGPPGALGWLDLTLGNPVTYGGLTLPIDLTPFGLVGCNMYVGADVSVTRFLGTTGLDRGYAAVDLPFPLVTSVFVIGSVVQAQWILLDPASLAYAATSKHQLRLQ
jgi:hypothetical protein